MMEGGPLFVSSGNLLADRRYNWALDHAARGEHDAAADILVQTVEIAPRFATAWYALGIARERLGDVAGAIRAFEQARGADPDDVHGATLQLARLGADTVTGAATKGYVRRLFDQYAQRYDAALLKGLGYNGPAALRDAVATVMGAAGRPPRFSSVLDLGCGTGLAGAAFRPRADRLVGVDLSPAMLERAKTRGIYDRLVTAELGAFLASEAAAGDRHDLIIAADVFVYVGDLAPVMTAIARVLAANGLVAFTVESFDRVDRNGATLMPTLRYAHGELHVRHAVANAGLELRHLRRASVRKERNAPVDGLVVIAARP